MFTVKLTETDLRILTSIVGEGKVNGFARGLKPDSETVDPGMVRDSFLERGSSAGWLFVDPETKESFLHEDMDFMLRIVTNPTGSFACGADGGNSFLWGCYFRNDAIVLVDHQEEEGLYEIAWVPTIPYALGAVYKKLKQWFLRQESGTGRKPGETAENGEIAEIGEAAETAETGEGGEAAETGEVGETAETAEKVLRCSLCREEETVILDWTAREDGRFSLGPAEAGLMPDTQTAGPEMITNGSFKETFDNAALWIVKAHGNSMRGMIENGGI